MMKKYLSLLIVLSPIIILNCSATYNPYKYAISYESFTPAIKIPETNSELTNEFHREVIGEKRTIVKDSTKIISGWITNNKQFLEKVIRPAIEPYLTELSKKHPVDIINELTIFTHQIFSKYFGKDFYRWGGDILDLDDPQEENHGYKYKYGLDCSGFAATPYELAVYFGLLNPDDESAIFSSKGFQKYCEKTNFKDKGGRLGTSNNYRLDTREMAQLGREIFRVKKGSRPTKEQIKKLQAGDLVGRNGHFGIIVEINGEPYYLESGGWVVPRFGGVPYRADKAMKIFAKSGEIMVRRSLPDKPKAEKNN
ncbi:MAG: hypothetical protein N3A61_07895 [Ignavibacteria bacterium]|nr:hypothetical protein [Ignavibacteria bacterium]